MSEFYVTSFCRFPHRLKDGKPINHKCYIIPPELIRMEMNASTPEEWEDCQKHWSLWTHTRRIVHRGVQEITNELECLQALGVIDLEEHF